MIYPFIYMIALQGALIYLLSIGNLSTNIPQFWAGLIVAFLAYALSAKAVMRGSFFSTKTILLFALVFRITMWFTSPSLSDDIYRYLWDGHVQLSGINPYILPPNDKELFEIRNEIFPLLNHRDIQTIYPPFSQIFFLFCAFIGKSIGIFKTFLIFVEGLLCLLLIRLLIDRKMDSKRVIFYAWHPLPLIEISGNGHIDILGIFFMMLFLFCMNKNRFLISPIILALGFLSKILPILLLPSAIVDLIRKNQNKYRISFFILIFIIIVVIFSAPYSTAGVQAFTGLFIYAKTWHFNDLIHGFLSTILDLFQLNGNQYARTICISLLAATIIYKINREADLIRIAFSTLTAFMILSPTLHPWYLLWTVPFFCLFPKISWILFSCLVFLSYEVLINYKSSGVWEEQQWVLWCEYVPLFSILLWEKLRYHRE